MDSQSDRRYLLFERFTSCDVGLINKILDVGRYRRAVRRMQKSEDARPRTSIGIVAPAWDRIARFSRSRSDRSTGAMRLGITWSPVNPTLCC